MTEPLLGVAQTLSKPLNDLYELGKDRYKRQLGKWKFSSNINNLYKKISAVQKVKTIWQIDKDVNLKKFYYPSKVEIDGIPKNINLISKLPDNNLVIQGTAGQGKSIFLRYLCSQELRQGNTVPVFFELRRIQPEESIYSNIMKELDVLGFDVDDELFEFIANSGKLTLLLDGFDELEPSLVTKSINELEYFSAKFPGLQIIITSRPDSGIERSAYFHVYKLAKLNKKDIPPLLEKLVGKEDIYQNLKKAFVEAPSNIHQLLTTPLLVTLMVIVYKSEQKIPDEFSGFYENLFPTLLSRHDKTKPGFSRKRQCSLNERDLQKLFEAFCFITRKNNLSAFSPDEFYDEVNSASEYTQIECDASDYIGDITKVTCLILEEGFKYYFIHKSVQEFYAANFIKSRPDSVAEKFYDNLVLMFGGWVQELTFLSQIDRYRYTKYYQIKQIEKTFEILNISKDISDEIERDVVKKILDNIDFYYVEGEFRHGRIVRYNGSTESYFDITRSVFDWLFMSKIELITHPSNQIINNGAIAGEDGVNISGAYLIESIGEFDNARSVIIAQINFIRNLYIEIQNYCLHEEDSKVVEFDQSFAF